MTEALKLKIFENKRTGQRTIVLPKKKLGNKKASFFCVNKWRFK